MQQYENVLIVSPLLSKEDVHALIAKHHTALKDGGAEIIHTEDWGTKELAYPIQKKTQGYYFVTEFRAPAELIKKIEVAYKRDENILRFLTLSLDKHAVAYNEKKRSGAFNKKSATAAEGVQS